MRSLNWTDHANFTKQQEEKFEEIDLKLLRWISEIVADGTEIRSLAGRSARLGDGTSRNPTDRDKLLEQRSVDIKGILGQVRGFNLDEFLSDWEPEKGSILPWCLGDHGHVAAPLDRKVEEASQPFDAVQVFGAAGGMQPQLKVLYVPDYISPAQRTLVISRMYDDLSRMLPNYEVSLALAEGPFEDDNGLSSHFGPDALGKYPCNTPAKQIPKLKVDVHVSAIKLARHAAMHRPKLIIGQGQGAVVAAAYAKAGSFEKVMETRNIQPA